MSDCAATDLLTVYHQLKDKYNLVLTTTAALDAGFTIDVPIIVGHAHGQTIQLYLDGSDFVLDVMDAAQTKGTHWHHRSVPSAVYDFTEFMQGKKDYPMHPFGSAQESGDKETTPQTCALLSRQLNLHHMKLNPSPFEMIKSGQKTIELRLYDEKRQQVKAGDEIVFTNIETGETLMKTVAQLYRFDSFDELYKSLPLLQCGYTMDHIDEASPADMAQYYSAEEQGKYGVVGIELF
jgi:ASC-1-like (ASCH) protein